jgi:HAD superfamily hydrolase (TIGR01509 family)
MSREHSPGQHSIRILALDAMGVIYPHADDVIEKLIPFITEQGGTRDEDLIQREYRQASLGRMASHQFWERVGLNNSVEEKYLEGFTLTEGLIGFLQEVCARQVAAWCLSNDVSEWSRRLRARLGLEKYFAGFLISGDVMARKPDPVIYRYLAKAAAAETGEMLFVDDRAVNLDAAAALGYRTAHFVMHAGEAATGNHRVVRSFAELSTLLE